MSKCIEAIFCEFCCHSVQAEIQYLGIRFNELGDVGYRLYRYVCENCNTQNSFRIFLKKEELQEIILNNAKLRRK